MSEDSTSTAAASAGISDSDFAEAAANPHSFSVDGLSQTNRSLSDLIEADKYLRMRSKIGASRGCNPFAGMTRHAIPPGTCDR